MCSSGTELTLRKTSALAKIRAVDVVFENLCRCADYDFGAFNGIQGQCQR